METIAPTITDWKHMAHELGKSFEARANDYDKRDRFVFENYDDLKTHRFFSAAVPEELGGGGVSHSEMCTVLRTLAHYCPSTSLAFSMHQHLIAATIWRYRNKNEGAPLLQRVANDQLILISTGAGDWLESNGEMTKTDGGFLVSAKKAFASQSMVGDIVVTSAPYLHPENGWQVMHFPVSMKSNGVSLMDDWHVMGMRGTGSHSIIFDKVFVPESSISLTRPRIGFHPVWDMIVVVAMPLVMSVYVGIAEKALAIAMTMGKKNSRNQKHLPYIIGKMNNTLEAARTQWEAMVSLANDLNFKPSPHATTRVLTLKTNVSIACIQTVQEAMDATGGQSFYNKNTLERLFRDVQGAQFHPIPMWDQYAFAGERLLTGVG